MKITKKLTLLLMLAFTVTLFSGCQKVNTTQTAAPAPDTSKITATHILDSAITTAPKDEYRVLCLLNGTLGDKGFYDNLASGFYRLRDELGWEAQIIEMGKDETLYEGYFLDASESGEWDLIVTGTFSVKNLVQQIALQFPEQKYMVADVAVDFSVVTTNNVMGVTYKSNETGFLGGALAALMLTESDNQLLDSTKQLLGFVGSVDASHINDFLVGYMEGINYISSDIKLLTNYVGTFSDVPTCLELTSQMYQQGAQIVYAPASQSIQGAVQASANANKLFIACDNDIWTISESTDPELVANILSSTMKNVGASIFDAAKGLKEGTYKVGENYVLGIKDGAVGLADNSNYQKLVPQSIREQMAEITQKIARGEIVVSSSFNMEAAEITSLREGMAP